MRRGTNILKIKTIRLLTSLMTLSLVMFVCDLAAFEETTRIYLIRHAEKATGDGADPNLTKIGLQRADNIARMLINKKIEVIFSTNYGRTLQTAKPLATLLGLEIELYDPRNLENFAKGLRTGMSNVLVVGHSNTTPFLVKLLGGDSEPMSELEYDRVYQLSITDDEVETKILRSQPIQ